MFMNESKHEMRGSAKAAKSILNGRFIILFSRYFIFEGEVQRSKGRIVEKVNTFRLSDSSTL